MGSDPHLHRTPVQPLLSQTLVVPDPGVVVKAEQHDRKHRWDHCQMADRHDRRGRDGSGQVQQGGLATPAAPGFWLSHRSESRATVWMPSRPRPHGGRFYAAVLSPSRRAVVGRARYLAMLVAIDQI